MVYFSMVWLTQRITILGWRANVYDADKALDSFSKYCFQDGARSDRWLLTGNPCNNGSGRNRTIDVNRLIKCVDGYAGHKFENLTDYRKFRNYVDTLTSQSRSPNNATGILWRSFDANPPKSGRLPGSLLETRKTSFPILFVTAGTDPVAPKRGAYKMSSVFPGSIVLTQASVGHTVVASVSMCYLKNVQMSLNGQVPAANTTCQADVLPFELNFIVFWTIDSCLVLPEILAKAN
ncbi:hypothetical protein CFD26_104116 [Aspergillus turcosus]|uniref:Peptidase S33 tripeptidyl aminopeptidase-like C-terminal domain-containing protein n=1 Tax=Aspergillus turcosus TaxID=1245748 RepID=A0A3R7HSG7_9EURO|nr:hypothetical protein CFD26_104116 [Aspergillus turcosus]